MFNLCFKKNLLYSYRKNKSQRSQRSLFSFLFNSDWEILTFSDLKFLGSDIAFLALPLHSLSQSSFGSPGNCRTKKRVNSWAQKAKNIIRIQLCSKLNNWKSGILWTKFALWTSKSRAQRRRCIGSFLLSSFVTPCGPCSDAYLTNIYTLCKGAGIENQKKATTEAAETADPEDSHGKEQRLLCLGPGSRTTQRRKVHYKCHMAIQPKSYKVHA